MGSKKNGMTIMTGSLRVHWIRYITHMDMRINPVDYKAISMGNMML